MLSFYLEAMEKGRVSSRPVSPTCLVLPAAPPPHAAATTDDVQRRALRQRRKIAQIVVRRLKAMLVVVAVQHDARALRPAAGKYTVCRRAGIERRKMAFPRPDWITSAAASV